MCLKKCTDSLQVFHILEQISQVACTAIIFTWWCDKCYLSEVLRLQKDFLIPAANTSITIMCMSGKHRVLSVLNDIRQEEESAPITFVVIGTPR